MPTYVLAQIFGPAFIVVGLSLLIQRDFYKRIIKDFGKETGYLYPVAFFIMLLGTFMVLSTVFYEWGLGRNMLIDKPTTELALVLIAIMGLGAFVKGALLLLAPDRMIKLARNMFCVKMCRGMAVITLVVGIYLSVYGYYIVSESFLPQAQPQQQVQMQQGAPQDAAGQQAAPQGR